MSKYISIRYQKSIHFKVFEIYIKKYQESIPSLKNSSIQKTPKNPTYFNIKIPTLKTMKI